MANDQDSTTKPSTIRGALLSVNGKILLAFFLVVVAAGMVVWMGTNLKGLDAGTAALLAGLVMLFVKMADNAVNYQYQSSSGSDKKDDAQTAVSKALADKVPAPPPVLPTAPIPPPVVVAWWSALTPDEQSALTNAGATDPKVQSFIDAAKVGKATATDLAYLVSKMPPLLTQDRATALAAI